MIDLDDLKRKTNVKVQYFKPGKYTAKILEVSYIDKKQHNPTADDTYMVRLEITNAYPGATHSIGEVVSWGKKINEKNIQYIDKFVAAAGGSSINETLDFGKQISSISGKEVYADVKEVDWQGNAFYTTTFSKHQPEWQTTQKAWNHSHTTTPPWQQQENIKPF